MDRKRRRRLIAAGLLLVLAVGVVAASMLFITISQNSDGVVLNQPGGPTANVTGTIEALPQSGGVSSGTIQWNTTAGNASFSSSGPTSATLDVSEIEGPWTNATGLDVSGADLTIDPGDKSAVVVGGSTDAIRFRQDSAVTIDDGTVDFVYTASGSGSVELRSLPANTDFEAGILNGGGGLGSFSSDGNGHATISLESATDAQVVLFSASDPIVEDATASPTGDLSQASQTFEIDVKDADFQTSQSDELTAELFIDGSSEGTDTLNSNGTAAVSATISTGGSHTVQWTVTDSYGLSTDSQEFTVNVPDELRIFNETDPGTLVSSPTTVTVQFFGEGGSVTERTTTTGVVDMTGLPAGQSFVVDAEAPTYHDRRIYVESLYEQQEIYLLNTSVTSADIVFSIVDESNQFSPVDESVLFVEKPLTISGSTEYRVITSDHLSATSEVPVTLEQEQRYRLRLLSPSGDETRVLGSYRPTGNDQAQLTVGEVTFEGGNATNPYFQSSLQEIDGNRFIRVVYDDPANATTDLSLEVQNRTDGSFLRPNTTESGPFGRYVETIPISAAKDDVAYNVSYHADRDGFDDEGGTPLVGDVPQIATGFGLDVGVLSMLGYLTILGVLGITCIAYPRYAGIPTVAVASFVVAIGVVEIHPLLIGGAGVISLIFAVGGGR